MAHYNEILFQNIAYDSDQNTLKCFGGLAPVAYELDEHDIDNARTPPPEFLDQNDDESLLGFSLSEIQQTAHQMENCKEEFSLDDPCLYPEEEFGATKKYRTPNAGLDSGGVCLLNEGFDKISLECNYPLHSEYDELSSDNMSVDSSSSSAASTRMSLSGMTDEQKYYRVRDQNNRASRDYRKRKNTKKINNEEKLKVLEMQNIALKLQKSNLQKTKEEYMKIKELLNRHGITQFQLSST